MHHRMFLFKKVKKVGKIPDTSPKTYILRINILFMKWSSTFKKLEDKCLITIFRMIAPIK
jgi:hypothetical protein